MACCCLKRHIASLLQYHPTGAHSVARWSHLHYCGRYWRGPGVVHLATVQAVGGYRIHALILERLQRAPIIKVSSHRKISLAELGIAGTRAP
jgi:hypothetical protein